ncbi:alpha/beta hydrolase family protein [Flavobacterium sp. 90]|uniref:alpha/beta fold hydrolase n=1 Tax=unclassified Flavobacterium TaxID=196869 RepID=UPI000EAE6A5F|nr:MULTISPECIES: alpha/beta hydrolase [unclassified Flavobacterium]RKR11372.1 alpha/beta hydrolase family protein [Flavobacterium sp. 81]TCK55153.1 alpha/beta hydrolase family protein [Flavobacterium sp. 90]
MKSAKNIIAKIGLSLFFTFVSCDKDSDNNTETLKEIKVDVGTHKLATYSIIHNSKYLVVFESGLGDGHSVWNEKKIPIKLSAQLDVLTYDRAGYEKSEKDSKPRNINQLRSELETVINNFSNGRKVILIGHSLGGMIIRDYAVKNPSKVAGLLFIDPAHEYYNQPSQEEEDMLYNLCKTNYGENYGGTREAREIIEDSQYMATLPHLPNIPVIVISSLKVDASTSEADKQKWFKAHELLKEGVSDFTHITTTKSGHYIMNDEPNLVIDNFNLILSKIK